MSGVSPDIFKTDIPFSLATGVSLCHSNPRFLEDKLQCESILSLSFRT
jgi:hypothetical protein